MTRCMKRGLSIFQYGDYRLFLRSHAEQVKARNPLWSYSQWARKLGLSGTAALTMVINGQRNPGPKLIEKLSEYFEFSNREAEYFQDLVKLAKFKHDPKLSLLIKERLETRHPRKTFRLLDLDSFRAISSWHFYAIREMTLLPHFRESGAWIASQLEFNLSPREAAAALGTLIRLKLVTRDESGRLRPSQGEVYTGHDVADEGIKRFHEQMIENAKRSIRGVPVKDRELNAVTVTLSRKKLQDAKALLRKFQDDFIELTEDSVNGDSVYQLNFQLFPLTKARARV